MPSFELQTLPPVALEISDQQSSYRADSPSRDSLSLNPGSQLAPVDGGRQAWTFLVCATAIETLVWGLPFSVGVLHSFWVRELFKGVEGAESTLTLAATLQTGLLYLLTVPFGPLLDRFPRCRLHLQIFGVVCGAVGLIGSAFATSPAHILVCLGIIYPLSCVYYMPAATLLFQWFSARRGLASGLMYSGTGLGGTIFPFLMQALLDRFGYKPSMIALGVGFGVVGGLTLLGIKPRLPIARSSAITVHRRTRLDWSFLRRSPFYAAVGCILISSCGSFIPTIWLPSYAQEVGSKPDGATLIALMNAASVPGLLLLGYMCDRLPLRAVISFSCFGSALSCMALWGFSGSSSAMLIAFVVTFGLLGLSFSACWSSLITIISKDDPSLPGLIFSALACARGIGNIASGPIASALLKSDLFRGGIGAYGRHNYGALLLESVVTMTAGAVVGMLYRT